MDYRKSWFYYQILHLHSNLKKRLIPLLLLHTRSRR